MKEDKGTAGVFGALWGVGRKVRLWQKEGLIDASQGAAILSFERKSQGAHFLKGIASLAVLAIAIGVLSLVAASWVHIPGSMKIATHFLLNILAAMTVWRAAKRGDALWREGALFLLFALNLTLIVLIGLVFHLSGNLAGALGLWLVISTPAMFVYGESLLAAVAWITAFLVTLAAVVPEILQGASDLTSFLVCLALCLFVPLLFIAAGLSKRCREMRPAWAAASFRLSVSLLTVGATLASLSWYDDIGRSLQRLMESANSFGEGYAMMALVCLSAPVAVLIYAAVKARLYGARSVDLNGVVFVTGSLVSIIAPLLLMLPNIEILGAVHFIAYWAFAGWIGYRLGYDRLVSSAITLICLRVIVIYLELFSSLLATGFGLIGSGIVILLFLRAAVSLNKKIGRKNA